jgi:hypothetical protein
MHRAYEAELFRQLLSAPEGVGKASDHLDHRALARALWSAADEAEANEPPAQIQVAAAPIPAPAPVRPAGRKLNRKQRRAARRLAERSR